MNTPEQELWQTVVYNAILESLYPGEGRERRNAKRDAIRWIEFGGRDFKRVCSLAGLDPDFIQDAWRAGRFNLADLKCSAYSERKEEQRKAREALNS